MTEESETEPLPKKKKSNAAVERVDGIGSFRHLLDIPAEDILVPYVLSTLSLPELFILRQVNTRCKELVDLRFQKSTVLNLEKFSHPRTADAFDIITSECHQLIELNLNRCGSWLTDKPLVRVLKNNLNLEDINLSYCDGLTRAGLNSIACFCSKLKKLSLKNTSAVTPTTICDICSRCKKLVEFDIEGCKTVNDEVIQMFASSHQNLRLISLCNITNITDVAVVDIASFCPELEHLDVRGCHEVTGAGIRVIGQKCLKLRFLGTSCGVIDEHTLRSLKTRSVTLNHEPMGQQHFHVRLRPFHMVMPRINNIPPNFQF